MTNREQFIHYVKYGGDHYVCSPQIGAGAGFDARLSGKTWLGSVSLQETMAVCRMFDMLPLYNAGLPDLGPLAEGVRVESSRSEANEGTRRIDESDFITPVGKLHSRMIEEEYKG